MPAIDAIKAQLRNDIRAAMLARQPAVTSALRILLGALDDAEAVPVDQSGPAQVSRSFGDPAGEVPRLCLSEREVREVIAKQGAALRAAAADLHGLGLAERAEALITQAVIIERYLGG